MKSVQSPKNSSDLESLSSIAEKVFPEQVAAIRAGDLNDDRIIKNDWHRECDESRELNRL